MAYQENRFRVDALTLTRQSLPILFITKSFIFSPRLYSLFLFSFLGFCLLIKQFALFLCHALPELLFLDCALFHI